MTFSPPLLQASGLRAVLPDGRVLYADLDLVLPAGPCALVGRNGAGKSTLLRQLAGTGLPAGAHVHAPGGVHLLAQHDDADAARVVDLLGAGARFDALCRLGSGTGDAADVACIGDDWHLEARLGEALAGHGFGGLALDRDASRLSAGQRQQLRLIGAWASDARVLLLDEPGTWLDAEASRAWSARMRERAGAVLAVSHDPAWLEPMPRLLELREGGLLTVEGGLAAWRALRDAQRANAERALAQARHARDRGRREAARERERIERRVSRGRHERAQANQSPLLLDRQRGRAERSAGRLRGGLEARLAAGDAAVRDAFAAADATPAPVFLDAGVAVPAGRRVLAFEGAHPCHPAPAQALDWQAAGPVRIGLQGRNGSGKTTLLRALRGEATLAAGRAVAQVPARSFDAGLHGLPADAPALDWLCARTGAGAAETANRLALLGLPGTRARQPLGTLSGGERMRVAIAAAAWAQPAAPLLLLDEPASHLDFESVEALVALLRAWPGALLVVGHDAAFLDALELTHRLHLDGTRLRLETAS
ncbi:ATP-binding cassette domain-containing protein [Luteimonas sp. Y-2-2-4F]|nr:ATP-binding cassette domain-containing protein [Luteimonas sp. Y-2-2-4F]MCD9032360.1 ATP-binding cassette domain-containing protein [Luteimonas sp. Y-2-2-4F]